MLIKKLLLTMTLAVTFSANAALSISFSDPTGTVGSTDSIDVWMTLTSDTDVAFDPMDPDGDMSYGGIIDPLDFPDGGFSPDANMGEGGFVAFDFVEFVGASLFVSCTGSFLVDENGCGFSSGGTEDYTFAFGPGWDPDNDGEMLAAGDSLDILLGTFTPVAGGAEAGLYDLFRGGVGLFVAGVGFDDFGEQVEVSAFIELAATCGIDDPSCAFSRNVTAVPVPAAVWLFASALLGLTGVSRRRT